MAAFRGSASTAEVALAAATAKTVIQLKAGAAQKVRVTKWYVGFDGVSATAAPVVVRVLRQTTAGTMTGLTPVKANDSDADTLTTTAQHTATVEPTAGDVLRQREVHPQQSYEEIIDGDDMVIGVGDRIGIECTAPATVNVIAAMQFEE